MKKSDYNEIARAFHQKLGMKQYLYAKRPDSDMYGYLEDIAQLAKLTANGLSVNDNFNRNKFLEACGLQRSEYDGDWRGIPNNAYRERANR